MVQSRIQHFGVPRASGNARSKPVEPTCETPSATGKGVPLRSVLQVKQGAGNRMKRDRRSLDKIFADVTLLACRCQDEGVFEDTIRR
jgi:hypothetical protein